MRTPLFLLLLLLASAAAAQTATTSCTVHFDPDADHIGTEHARALAALAASLDPARELMISIEGHTDLDGGNAYNEGLAVRRANAVRAQLVEAGIPPAAITVRAFGERKPVAFGVEAGQKEQNRRVEVTCTYAALRDIHALEEALGADERTRATIDPARVNYVAGQNGAVVRIPANALTDADGNPVEGSVDITLTEALSTDRMMTSRLSTVSGGRMLETGGMLRIEARDNQGRDLRLRSGDSLLVALPTNAQQAGMELFVSLDGSDWTATGNKPLPPLPKMDLPDQPNIAWPHRTRPRFTEDISLRPRRPGIPGRPTAPIPPRRESYTTTPRWYQFPLRARLRAQDDLRFRFALERHAERVVKYDERVRRYEEECRQYPAARTRYVADSIAYLDQLAEAKVEFERTVVAESDSLYTLEFRATSNRHNALMKDWRTRCDAYMRAYASMLDSLGLAGNTEQVSRYVFTVNNLGWINCDRFYSVPPEEKRELIVQDPDATEERVYLVFKNLNSLMALGRDQHGRYISSAIPRNEPAELIAYKVLDGQAMLCRQPVEQNGRMTLAFKPARITDVRKALEEAGNM